MKTIAAAFAIFISCTGVSYATPESDALGKCLVGNSTGNDRIAIGQWMFGAIVRHPALADMSAISEQRHVQLDKNMALIVERLLTKDCSVEIKAVSGGDMNQGLEAAFATLGAVAMKELTGDQATGAAMGKFGDYLDKASIQKAFSGAK